VTHDYVNMWFWNLRICLEKHFVPSSAKYSKVRMFETIKLSNFLITPAVSNMDLKAGCSDFHSGL